MSLRASAGFISAIEMFISHGRALPSMTLAKICRSFVDEPPWAPPIASQTLERSLRDAAGILRVKPPGQTEPDAPGCVGVRLRQPR